MAENKKKRTVRQRTTESAQKKPRRLKAAGGKLARPLGHAAKVGKREYHPVRLPDNKAGRILGKRVRFVPKYFSDAWAEIRQVTWPSRSETTRLTVAVFIFSVIFTAIVAVLDFGLDKLFREIIIE